MAGKKKPKSIDPCQRSLKSFFTSTRPLVSDQVHTPTPIPTNLPSPAAVPSTIAFSSRDGSAHPGKRTAASISEDDDGTTARVSHLKKSKLSAGEIYAPVQPSIQRKVLQAHRFKLDETEDELSDGEDELPDIQVDMPDIQDDLSDTQASDVAYESDVEQSDTDDGMKIPAIDIGADENASLDDLARNIDAAQDDDHEVTEDDAKDAITACEVDTEENEATFNTQVKKLTATLKSSMPHLLTPVEEFLNGQTSHHQPKRFPQAQKRHKYRGFGFYCKTMKELYVPIIDKYATYCESDSNPGYKLQNLVTPSGTINTGMLAMAHYPTFTTKNAIRSETADVSNPCMRMLGKAVQGMDRILIFDRMPIRLKRQAVTDTPESIMPAELVKIFDPLWEKIWKASNAKTAILLGRLQAKNYASRFPQSTKVALYDETFYGNRIHMFVEWESGFEKLKVKRLVFVVYHMESWLRCIWPQTIISIKESMASALVFAFPTWAIGKTWNLPMKPLTSVPRLVRAITSKKSFARVSIKALSCTDTKALRKTTVPHIDLRKSGRRTDIVRPELGDFGPGPSGVTYDDLNIAVRLAVAEFVAGISFPVAELPADMARFAKYDSLDPLEDSYNFWPASLTRAFHGLDVGTNPLHKHLHFLTDSEKDVVRHPHAHIFLTTMWPILIRMSRAYRDDFGIENREVNSMLHSCFQYALGRSPNTILNTLEARNAAGGLSRTFQLKTIEKLQDRRLDYGDVNDLIDMWKDETSDKTVRTQLKRRIDRRGNFKEKEGYFSHDSLNKIFVPSMSDTAAKLLQNADSKGINSVRAWYRAEMKKDTKVSAGRNVVYRDDLNVLNDNGRRAWEKRVLSRVLAFSKGRLPQRFLSEWATTVGTIRIEVY